MNEYVVYVTYTIGEYVVAEDEGEARRIAAGRSPTPIEDEDVDAVEFMDDEKGFRVEPMSGKPHKWKVLVGYVGGEDIVVEAYSEAGARAKAKAAACGPEGMSMEDPERFGVELADEEDES